MSAEGRVHDLMDALERSVAAARDARARADVCPVHGVVHQQRERAVQCVKCGTETWNPHALCDRHDHLAALEVTTT